MAIILWFQKAAEQGHCGAQHSLAIQYHSKDGDYVPHDDTKAFEWALKSAKQGYIRAQFTVGYYFYEGIGTKQNYVAAVEYFSKAAEQKHVDALRYLGECYYYGKGVESKNIEKAKELTLEAATWRKYGDYDARQNLKKWFGIIIE